jgi:hypothetical protein
LIAATAARVQITPHPARIIFRAHGLAKVLKKSAMWGLTLQFWQSVVLWANVVALAGGVLTGAALFVSAWVSSNIADVVQQDADRRITEAQTRGDEARADAAKANQRASEAAERAASLEKETALANERAAELKLALEKEIAARQPRLINPQQRVQLVAALTKIIPKGQITVTWKLFDEEAERFGKQILEALNESGFDAKEIRGPFGFGISGQWILVRDLKKYQAGPSWVGDVQTAFNTIVGMNFDGQQMESTLQPEYGEVSIAVGAKP